MTCMLRIVDDIPVFLFELCISEILFNFFIHIFYMAEFRTSKFSSHHKDFGDGFQ